MSRSTKSSLTIKTGDGDDAAPPVPAGRPSRKNAGKRSIDPNYVNSTEAIHDAIGDLRDERKQLTLGSGKKQTKRKRPRTPSPQPQPLSPVECPTQEDFDALDVVDATPQLLDPADMEPMSLTFNIPANFEGPLKIVLDPSMFVRQAAASSLRRGMAFSGQAHKRARREEAVKAAKNKRVAQFIELHGKPRGFCDLPPELRNNIYRQVLVTKEPIDFPQPKNASRGAAFLRTCRLVHQEGCSILYTENRFTFRRTKISRVPFWAAEGKEVGYMDMRHFLNMIGPDNRAFLRRLHIVFEDATRPYITNLPEGGSFIYDTNLMACLKVISKECWLKKISLSFSGRRSLSKLDVRFLDALCAVQVDELGLNPENQWSGAKYCPDILDLLRNEMLRDDPLYDTDKLEKSKRFNPGHVNWLA